MAPKERPWDDDAVVVSRNDLRDFNEEGLIPLPDEKVEAIRAWLQPTSYSAENSECSKHRASHLAGTGDWLWNAPSYTAWHESHEHGMLLIKGIPGSGKSVIAGSLVDRLSREDVPVLYFFFRQIIDANHAPIALLRDWLDQVVVYSPPLQAQLDKYLESRQTLAIKSMNDLWKDLKIALGHLPKVYCVVDALDEIDDGNEDFLKELAELGRWRPAHIKVVATSRPVPRVEHPIRQIPMKEIRLEEKIIDMDIGTYVEHHLGHSSIPVDLHAQIKRVVPGRANGLFLYAKLAMEAFLKPGADVMQVMAALPADLNVLYTDLLQQHILRSGVPEHLQILILSWVTHASRPLRLLEIAEMINKTQSIDLSDFRAIKELVRTSCGPLLEILPDETVSVVHHSLTEFLNGSTRSPEKHMVSTTGTTSYPILDQGSTHSRLARVCISYILGSKCLDGVKTKQVKKRLDLNGGSKTDDDIVDVLDQCSYKRLGGDDEAKCKRSWNGDLPATPELRSRYPFLAYCLDNWHVHVRKADSHSELSEDLLGDVDKLLAGTNCLALEALERRTACGWKPIHVASCNGLSQYVSHLMARGGTNVDMDDRYGEKPLLFAAGGGHAPTVKVLLAAGAKPDQESLRDGSKPLHKAATSNNGDTVKFILQAGVDPMTKKTREDPDWYPVGSGTTGYTPLMMAFLNGHLESARAFIPYLSTKRHVYRALGWAVEGGHYSLVEEMLKRPLVNVNTKIRGETPLMYAAKRHDFRMMILLLRAGADPTITADEVWGDEFEDYDTDEEEHFEGEDEGENSVMADKGGPNALHILCGATEISWSSQTADEKTLHPGLMEETVSLMLDAGVDINGTYRAPSYYNGGSPLGIAASRRPALVRTLIRAGADVTARSSGGSTVLHNCLNPDLIQLMVEEGNADLIHAETSTGLTPLLCASGSGKMTAALARKFSELGANMTHTGPKGEGALHRFFSGYLFRFKCDQVVEIVEALLAAGVPPNSKNHDGETVLHRILKLTEVKSPFGDVSKRVVSALLAAGADIHVRDNEGKNPLFKLVSEARSPDRVAVVQMLAELGADINGRDFRGRNLYFYRPKRDSEAMVRTLVSWGIDPAAVDYEGNPMDWSLAPPGHKNNAGETYVHWLAANQALQLEKTLTTFDNFDAEDNAGIRPIHHFAKDNDKLVALALNGGACAVGRTHKGMSPLQVAAAFRQPNIVGRLIDAIKAKKGTEFLKSHIDYNRNGIIPSALQYACQTRMPETASLLLDAGADPGLAFSPRIPRLWCETVQKKDGYEFAPSEHVESGLYSTISQWNRWNGSGSVSGRDIMPRLEPIMDLLYSRGAMSGEKIDAMIGSNDGDDYATECLLKLRQRVFSGEEVDVLEHDQRAALSKPLSALELYADALLRHGKDQGRGNASRSEDELRDDASLDNNETCKMKDGLWNALSYASLVGVYRRASARRAFVRTDSDTSYDHMTLDGQWDLILYKAQKDPELFKTDYYGNYVLSKFTAWGLVSMLRVLITPQRMQELDGEYEERFLHSKIPSDSDDNRFGSHGPKPLLLQACERSIDNLPMLRFLVEELGANIDIQDLEITGSREMRKHVKGNGALHELASNGNWWAAARGLPYLLEQGAEVDLRDKTNRTPLMHAHSAQGAHYLIDHGADVNAQDNFGLNCLTHATQNLEIVKLLMSCGASVQPEVFHCLLKERTMDESTPLILDTICTGIDVNSRCTSLHSMATESIAKEVPVIKQERYALYLAAAPNPMFFQPGSRIQYSRDQVLRRNLPVIDILLKHGANLYASFFKRGRPSEDNPEDSGEEVTLLHDLLEIGGLVEPLLSHKSTELERLDNKGRTLLLAACRSELGPDAPIGAVHSGFLGNLYNKEVAPEQSNGRPSLTKYLIEKGACVTARDNDRKNALHHIFESRTTGGLESFSLIMSLAPELVHQVDSSGASPLLYALRRFFSPMASDTRPIKMLLDAGVNPHVEDAQGNSPLHILGARLAGHGWSEEQVLQIHELYQRFISLGLPINGRNKQGETPVLSFFKNQGLDVGYKYSTGQDAKRQQAALDIFSAAEANTLAVDADRNTLLHTVAATAGSLQNGEAGELMVQRFQWLINQGLDIIAENSAFQTCLDIAMVNGNQAILKLFERKEKE
ncbi:unnamed protein product [Clonostachys byssicola]|uniref:NACHT domain-containing protein n=1 Tax=Clonostachys byssicola TaxID=160290 RepID=A0A9N9Y8P0_9HYPO|nr:unnamed protein product [Clonostachys byssicola]